MEYLNFEFVCYSADFNLSPAECPECKRKSLERVKSEKNVKKKVKKKVKRPLGDRGELHQTPLIPLNRPQIHRWRFPQPKYS